MKLTHSLERGTLDIELGENGRPSFSTPEDIDREVEISKAISLKRIADALDQQNRQLTNITEFPIRVVKRNV